MADSMMWLIMIVAGGLLLISVKRCPMQIWNACSRTEINEKQTGKGADERLLELEVGCLNMDRCEATK